MTSPAAHARNAGGITALHVAADRPGVLRVLLEHGADPNVRDPGDNALPLHFAAGGGHLESVRVLLDAGSDVQELASRLVGASLSCSGEIPDL